MSKFGTTFGERERMLILAKTYPTPSSKSVETTCVAAVSEGGELRRIFPVPFRLLPHELQFNKWQWVTANFRAPNDDRRPESRRIDVDSLVVGETLTTGKDKLWSERMRLVEPHSVLSFNHLEQKRQNTGETLGFVKPSRIIGLDITPLPPAEQNWTMEQIEKLTRDLEQGDLFGSQDKQNQKRRVTLEKIPFHFHYRYEIDCEGDTIQYRHLITDWEAGELYRNCLFRYRESWQEKFRAKLETEFLEKDLYFMMGTQHRFPDQWLIISIVYPPKGRLAQHSLFL